MSFSVKGLFIIAFTLIVFNIGLTLHGVDKETSKIATVLVGMFAGPYFITGRIFDDEDQKEEDL